jgi:hypothetical protein
LVRNFQIFPDEILVKGGRGKEINQENNNGETMFKEDRWKEEEVGDRNFEECSIFLGLQRK